MKLLATLRQRLGWKLCLSYLFVILAVVIVLDITAESGPGNLLGNLLCAVAGLLDNPSGLARLLNQILAILG